MAKDSNKAQQAQAQEQAQQAQEQAQGQEQAQPLNLIPSISGITLEGLNSAEEVSLPKASPKAKGQEGTFILLVKEYHISQDKKGNLTIYLENRDRVPYQDKEGNPFPSTPKSKERAYITFSPSDYKVRDIPQVGQVIVVQGASLSTPSRDKASHLFHKVQ